MACDMWLEALHGSFHLCAFLVPHPRKYCNTMVCVLSHSNGGRMFLFLEVDHLLHAHIIYLTSSCMYACDDKCEWALCKYCYRVLTGH